MTTTANEIQSACLAGLILSGQNDDKQPEWIGTAKQFKKCGEMIENVEIGEALDKI